MRKFIYTFSILAVFAILSCDDFLDVNADPNRVTEVSLSAQLPPVIEGTSQVHYSMASSVSQITQHLGSYFGYPDEISLGGSWSTIYLRNLNNAQQIMNNAEAQDAPHYAGVARVLMAFNLGLATDVWEDVPFSEAFNGSENLTPNYDSQQQIYAEISSLLDRAIQDLNASESFLSPTSVDDFAYGGDLDKWSKLAYALKARYQVHLINKNGAGNILNDISNAFQDNSDDFEIAYNSVNLNPWHSNIALANNTGNLSSSFGSYFIDHINGTLIAAADPRLPIITDTVGITNIIGIKSFDESADDNTVDFEEENWYSRFDSPIPMVTYAEMKFVEAEAALSSDANRAYSAYQDGIRAHMSKLGVDDTAIQAYLSDPDVDVGAGNLTSGQIMQQKYIALFLNPESWVDMRRIGYENLSGFEIPDPSMFNGPAQRALYPADELNRNGNAVAAARKPYEQKMWRDQ